MKKFSTVWMIWRITEAVIAIIAGILFAVLHEEVADTLGIVAGAFIILEGVLMIVYQLISPRTPQSFVVLATGTLVTSLGILLVSNPEILETYLVFLVACSFMIGGALIALNASFKLRDGKKQLVIGILQIILATVMIVGAALMFWQQTSAIEIIMICIGGVLMILGVVIIINLIRIAYHLKKNTQVVQTTPDSTLPTTTNAEVTDVEIVE